MERRHKPAPGNPPSGVKKNAAEKMDSTGSPRELPVAVASDGNTTLAMLVRRKGETLAQLLTRLDLAIAKAYDEEIFTDEINS